MSDELRTYLARVLPWPETSPPYINIHWTFIPKGFKPDPKLNGQDKLPWSSRACTSLEDAVGVVKWVKSLQDSRDIYVCQSSQLTCIERTTKTGRKYLYGVRNQPNAIGFKSLWIDVDFKLFADEQAAVTSLGNFINKVDLPQPSVIVRSGGGLHVYWVFDHILTAEEWQPLADMLEAAMDKEEFPHDSKITPDGARVLRVPETFNWKYNPPRITRVVTDKGGDYNVQRIERAITPYKDFVRARTHELAPGFSFDASLFPRRPKVEISELGANVEPDFAPMTREEIRECLDAIPNDKTDWSFWNTMGMRVYAACEGADYGREEWQSWTDTRPITKPTDTCADRWVTFHTSPPTRTGAGALIVEARHILGNPKWFPAQPTLVAPPHINQALPLSVGQSIMPSSVSVTDLPSGYQRDQNGVIKRHIQYEDGTAGFIPITNYAMVSPWIEATPEGGILHFTTTQRNKPHECTFPLSALNTMQMRSELNKCGIYIPVDQKEHRAFQEFMMAWVDKIKEIKESVRTAPFGWHMDKGEIAGFAYNGRLWTPKGDHPAASGDKIILRWFTPEGNRQRWFDAVKLITNQERPDLECLIATSFGAPLIRFSGEPGCLISVYSSESGTNKTTSMKLAQSVWGRAGMTSSLGDTVKSVVEKMGEIRSLPLLWDELKTAVAMENFLKLTFQITEGRSPTRLTQSAAMREPKEWQTLVVAASNDSLLDYITKTTKTTPAGLYRIFEYEILPPTSATPGRMDGMVASNILQHVNNNYGWVGAEYAKYLGENFDKVGKDYLELGVALRKEIKAEDGERFWAASMAAILHGAVLANVLFAVGFNIPKMKEHLILSFYKMREFVGTSTVDISKSINLSSIMQQFFAEARSRHCIYTNRIWVGAGRPQPQSIKFLEESRNLDGIWMQVGKDDHILRFSRSQFKNFLQKNGLSPLQIFRALNSQYQMKDNIHGYLAGGTGMSKTQAKEYLCEIDLYNAKDLDFITQ